MDCCDSFTGPNMRRLLANGNRGGGGGMPDVFEWKRTGEEVERRGSWVAVMYPLVRIKGVWHALRDGSLAPW